MLKKPLAVYEGELREMSAGDKIASELLPVFTTIEGYSITDAYTKAEVDTSVEVAVTSANSYTDTTLSQLIMGSFGAYQQLVPAETWTIEHNLGRYPSVTIVDSAGSVVVGNVDYVTDNTLTVSFTATFSGKAYLN